MTDMTPEKRLLDFIKQAQGKLRLRKELKVFTKVNIVLIGLIVLVLAVFLLDVCTFKYNIPEANIDMPEEETGILPALSDLDEDIDKDAEILVEEKDSISEKDLIKDLALLGIVRAEEDQAIIEDKEAKKTFFLYRGESFEEFTLFDIRENGVILDYKGQRIELNM